MQVAAAAIISINKRITNEKIQGNRKKKKIQAGGGRLAIDYGYMYGL